MAADVLRLGIKCNQRCLFCTAQTGDENETTTQEAKELIDYIAINGTGTLAITGGEPTIRDDLITLIRYAKTKGIQNIELQTNAVRLTDNDYAIELVKSGVNHFFIALHSHDEKISDFLTQSKGFNSTIRGIKNLVKLLRQQSKMT